MRVTHFLVCTLPDNPVHAAAGKLVTTDWNHDHVIEFDSADVVTALGYTPVTNARTVSAGAGLSGGGDLSANRTISLDLASANVWTATQTVPRLVAATGAITASEPVLDLSQTWDNAAVEFTGIKLNVTNTASAAGSMLADWQMGGASHFQWLANKFRVYGTYTDSSNYVRASLSSSSTAVTLAAETAGTGADVVDLVLTSTGLITTAQEFKSNVALYVGNDVGICGGAFGAEQQGVVFGNSFGIKWSNDAYRWGTKDTGLMRNAAGVVEVNNGTAGTYRDLTLRNVVAQSGYSEMVEMTAPAAGAANTARIYAVDNGGGKTQLMVIFASGAAQQIAIEP